MKDERLLAPEDFCNIDEALTHAKELQRLLIKLSNTDTRIGLYAVDLRYQLALDLPWLESYIADDIKAAKELP